MKRRSFLHGGLILGASVIDGRAERGKADRVSATPRTAIVPQEFGQEIGSSFEIDAAGAINAAIRKGEEQKRDVYIPQGQYGLLSEIVMREGVRVYGPRTAELKRTSGYGVLRNWLPGGSYSGRTAPGNWMIQGLTLNANGSMIGPLNPGFTFSCVGVVQAKGVRFIGTVFTDVYNGHFVDLGGVQDVHFEDCLFSKFTDAGGRHFSECIQIDICSIEGQPAGMHPSTYDNAPCEGVYVSSCKGVGVATLVGSHGWGGIQCAKRWHSGIHINGIESDGTYEILRAQRWRN